MEKFILIDGNSLINRGFYATPVMNAPDGTPTNAVLAFVNILIKLIEDVKPNYIMVAFDRKEPTFRHKIYADYKGTRKPMPDDLRPQIPLLKEVLSTLGIAHFDMAGIEADDIIGTLSKRFCCETIIITGDKDSFQLVDETSKVFFTRRGVSDIEEYNAENFKEKVGIEPSQITDLKALMGDSSDNIPGVKGVGEKTALSLIQTYGNIETLYNKIGEVKGKLQEKLILDKDNAFLSKTLATINTQVDMPFTEDNCVYSYPFNQKAKELFTRLNFKSLLKKNSIFSQEEVESKPKTLDVKTIVAKSKNEIMSFIKTSKFSVVISDFVSFYNFDGVEVNLKIKDNFFDDGFLFDEAICALKDIFENKNNSVLVYGKKSIIKILKENNVFPQAKFDDLLLLKYLVDYQGKEETFSEISIFNSFDKNALAFSQANLFEELLQKATDEEKRLYYDVELKLSDVLLSMEEEGVKVDKDNLEKMSLYYKGKIDDLSKRIKEIAGEDVNLNSTKQLSYVLFEKLGLKHGKKNKGGAYSTNVEILEDLAEEHEIIPLILTYRKYAKLLSTYIDGFKPLIEKDTGVIKTTYFQAQTATGRLSSRKPNLQNIPVRDEEGKEVRKLFSARSEDRILIDADYSQIELRLLAEYSKCQTLIDAFKNGEDIHTDTASRVFGVKKEDVTKDMRRSAKAVNFGIIYGISDYGLAENLKISPKTAGEYIKKYFETYPEVKKYMEENVLFAKNNGFAITPFGRKRVIYEINSSNYNQRTFGERAAMNMPLQGAAADIIKIAMINVHNRLKKEGLKSKLILQVHDELIIDAYLDEKEVVEKLLKYEMENAVKLEVPLTVEVSSSYNWFDCK